MPPQSERTAVIGSACRFAGGIDTPDGLWKALLNETVAISDWPTIRGDLSGDLLEGSQMPGKTPTLRGGYVDDPFLFDNNAFGISAAEALEMDPQQRWLIELCWLALQNAGLTASELAGKRVGLFLSAGDVEYAQRTIHSGDRDRITAFSKLGSNRAVGVGRVAYIFGFNGPAIAVDATCASSLVAVHLGCQSLHADECDIAIAGGINLITSSIETIGFAQLGAMSPAGNCRPFEAAADGYVRGEGGGVVVLKRASEAIANRDRIDCFVVGSAVNNDGRSNGFTAPNGVAQRRVILDAMARAGLQPDQVGFVEAHGTGTVLGDPIELAALRDAYATASRPRPLVVGALKANIGHTESAAGIAGFIKAVQTVKHRQIAPQPGFSSPTERFRWDRAGLEIARSETAFASGQVAIAGVSSFGLSGTNCHILVQEADRTTPPPPARQPSVPRVATLSARTSGLLNIEAKRHLDFLSSAATDCRNYCYSTTARRDPFQARAAFVGKSVSELKGAVQSFCTGGKRSEYHAGEALVEPGLTILIPGLTRWPEDTVTQLLEGIPAFSDRLRDCLARVERATGRLLEDCFFSGRQLPDVQQYLQLGHFALTHALAETWQHLGVEPKRILGHSLGEHVAATLAGALALDDALALVSERGRLFDTIAPNGAMLLVGAGHDLTSKLAGEWEGLFVSAINGPRQTGVSGSAEAIARFEEALRERGLAVRRAEANQIPAHTPLLSGVAEKIAEFASQLAFRDPQLEMYSSLTGERIAKGRVDHDHFSRLTVEPVAFDTALRAASSDNAVYLEVGPDGRLTTLATALTKAPGRAVQSLGLDVEPAVSAAESFAHACAKLYCAGISIDWSKLYGNPKPVFEDLPAPVLDQSRFEIEPIASHEHAVAAWPGKLLPAMPEDQLIRHEVAISASSPAWLDGHRIDDAVVFPAAAYCVGLANAVGPRPESDGITLTNIHFLRPLTLASRALLHIAAEQPGRFSIHGRDQDSTSGVPWTKHCEGNWSKQSGAAMEQHVPDATLRLPVSEPDFYQRLGQAGLSLTGAFRRLTDLRTNPEKTKVCASIRVDQPAGLPCLSPMELDAVFQVAGVLLQMEAEGFPVPQALETATLYPVPNDCEAIEACATLSRHSADGSHVVDIRAYDNKGKLIADIAGLTFSDSSAFRASLAASVLTYADHWSIVECAQPIMDRASPIELAEPVGTDLPDDGHWLARIAAAELADKLDSGGSRRALVLNLRKDSVPDATGARACHGLLDFYQRVLTKIEGGPVSVTLLLHDALVTSVSRPKGPAQSGLVGLFRTLAREGSGCNWRLIDCDETCSDETLERLLQMDLAENGGEYAIRGDTVWTRTLRPGPVVSAPAADAGSDAWSVVLGAFGAIGSEIAQALARLGMRRLALVGRNLPDNLAAFVSEIDPAIEVRILKADVLDEGSLQALVSELEAEAPIGNVHFCAAVLDDGLAVQLDRERFREVYTTKSLGALNLERLFGQRPQTRVLLYSSVAGRLGTVGQSAYAAASTFLDGLAQCSTTAMNCVAIDWGLWEKVSASIKVPVAELSAQTGIRPLPKASVDRVLHRALIGDDKLIMPLQVDWAAFLASGPVTAPLAKLHRAEQVGSAPQENSISEIGARLVSVLHKVAVDLPEFDLETPLTMLGLDSLALMEFRSRMQREFETVPQLSQFRTDITLGDLVRFYEQPGDAKANLGGNAEGSGQQDVIEFLL